MAAFFGEILPAISRAVDDEDDVLPPKIRRLAFEYTEPEITLKADSIIIAASEVAACFLEAHYGLKTMHPVAKITEVKDVDDDDGFEAVSRQNLPLSSIYQHESSNKSTIFVVCKSYIPPEQIWPWTATFFENVKPVGDIVVLTSAPIHEFKCEDSADITAPIVRCLSTTTRPNSHPVAPLLEQPNMLKGVAAAVVSYGEIHKIPAIVYNCYTETLHLDLPSVQAFSPLLGCQQFPKHAEREVALKTILTKVRNTGSARSLYT